MDENIINFNLNTPWHLLKEKMPTEDQLTLLKLERFKDTCDGTFEWETWVNMDDLKAFQKGAEAIRKLNQIKQIINSPIPIQEDVLRYKMICEVMKDANQNS